MKDPIGWVFGPAGEGAVPAAEVVVPTVAEDLAEAVPAADQGLLASADIAVHQEVPAAAVAAVAVPVAAPNCSASEVTAPEGAGRTSQEDRPGEDRAGHPVVPVGCIREEARHSYAAGILPARAADLDPADQEAAGLHIRKANIAHPAAADPACFHARIHSDRRSPIPVSLCR